MRINWPNEKIEDKVEKFLERVQEYFTANPNSWAADFSCSNDVGKYLIEHKELWENFVVGYDYLDSDGFIVIAKDYDSLDKHEMER